MKKATIKSQLEQHFVAILSLLIAVVALGYTTWREEVTEKNRNTRQAAFIVLKNLGELQVIVNETIYEPNKSAFLGWGHVAMISDLGSLLPSPIPQKTQELAATWGTNWQKLKTDEAAQDATSAQIDACRTATLEILHQLR